MSTPSEKPSAFDAPQSTLDTVLRPDVFAGLPDVVAGFSTRQGGVSDAPYDTLNLSQHVGDDPDAVVENRRRFCEALGVAPGRLATAQQVHENAVQVVDAPGETSGCDALVTDTPGVLLALTGADCAIVLLADSEARVVGACHAGWRGAVSAIHRRTLDAMQSLGAEPARMRAYVSPCIGVEAFEVGEEVATQFPEAVVHRRDDWRRPHVDLKAFLRRDLEDARLTRVEVAEACTFSREDLFFSYRRDGTPMGCMFGAIGLLEASGA